MIFRNISCLSYSHCTDHKWTFAPRWLYSSENIPQQIPPEHGYAVFKNFESFLTDFWMHSIENSRRNWTPEKLRAKNAESPEYFDEHFTIDARKEVFQNLICPIPRPVTYDESNQLEWDQKGSQRFRWGMFAWGQLIKKIVSGFAEGVRINYVDATSS